MVTVVTWQELPAMLINDELVSHLAHLGNHKGVVVVAAAGCGWKIEEKWWDSVWQQVVAKHCDY